MLQSQGCLYEPKGLPRDAVLAKLAVCRIFHFAIIKRLAMETASCRKAHTAGFLLLITHILPLDIALLYQQYQEFTHSVYQSRMCLFELSKWEHALHLAKDANACLVLANTRIPCVVAFIVGFRTSLALCPHQPQRKARKHVDARRSSSRLDCTVVGPFRVKLLHVHTLTSRGLRCRDQSLGRRVFEREFEYFIYDTF